MTKYKIIVLVVIILIVVSIIAVFSDMNNNMPDDSIYSCTLEGESNNWEIDSLKIFLDQNNSMYGDGYLISKLEKEDLQGFTYFEFLIYMTNDNFQTLIYETSASSYAPMYYIEKKSHLEFKKTDVNTKNIEEAEFKAVIRIRRKDESMIEEEIKLEKNGK